ncbi:SIR2 family protein [Pseudomonas sp. 9Ag]|uniref:SIR2 family protein n=1 Tax=Pseudomonas sp. 9Ag TaxID=2653167 RepID=UPI0012EF6539|nr:SIR2 family protein [Pseudomonas sp. 9Ag]VXC33283.1 putative SIR2-like domain-containing protein [Pseudomonas sp. 9Ag]
MDTTQLVADNPHKQRTVDDIARFLKTRVEKNPNYCLLLGAGCSVTSGIPSGGELIDQWRREIFYEYSDQGSEYSTEEAKKLLKERFSQWYSETNEYSSLFEKKYDLPSQRRKFIEELVSEKIPSIGYAYLVNLVKNNYLNSIFTTNFDDLLNEAFYHYSDRRPMLCAHDSSVNSINLYSSRPKIIKLHGDYLFDDIKGSLRETESLEQNTKNKLVETLKGQGLIAVGYAGYDRSVMDVISYLLRLDDHLTNGVYWCVRRGETISEEVRKLLWRDKVYYVLIDGFDEFFAELNLKLTKCLSLEQDLTNNKTSKIIESYTSNKFLLQSNSEIIRSDVERLSKQKAKSNISRLIQELTEKDQVSEFDDAEMAALMTIEALIMDKNYTGAISQCQDELNKAPKRELRRSLTAQLGKAYILADMTDKAIECNEQLKTYEPNDPRPYLAIASIENNSDKKIKIIDEAIEVSPYEYIAYDKKASLLIERARHLPSSQKVITQALAREALTTSINLNPSHINHSWGRLYDLEYATERPNSEQKQILLDIITALDKQGPFNSRSISLKAHFYGNFSDKEQQAAFFEALQNHQTKVKQKDLINFKEKLIKAAYKLDLSNESKELIDDLLSTADENKDSEAIITAGVTLAQQFGEFSRAAKILSGARNIADDYEASRVLMTCQALTKDKLGALATLETIKQNFNLVAYLTASADIHDDLSMPGKAVEATKKLLEITKDKDRYTSVHAYALIKNSEFEVAKKILSEYLNENKFDRSLSSEIVNFEICRRSNGGKCDKVRLAELLKHASSDLEKAAINSLLDENQKAIAQLKTAIEKDKTDLASVLKWPAFDNLRPEKDFIQLIDPLLKKCNTEPEVGKISNLRAVG